MSSITIAELSLGTRMEIYVRARRRIAAGFTLDTAIEEELKDAESVGYRLESTDLSSWLALEIKKPLGLRIDELSTETRRQILLLTKQTVAMGLSLEDAANTICLKTLRDGYALNPIDVEQWLRDEFEGQS